MSRFLFTLALLLVALASCSPSPAPTLAVLEQVDSLTAQDPKRAIVVLDSLLPTLASADSSARVFHQLLCVKARDRAYIRHTSDRDILQVIDYYERHPEGDKLAWAYCYGGRVYRDLDDTPRALSYLQKSLSELADGRNPNLRQRVLSQVGYLFYYQHLFAESRAVKREVIAADSLLGNYDRMVTCYTDIARCYIAEAHYDSAAWVAHYACALASQHQLSRMTAATDLLTAQVNEYQGRHDEALHLLTPYLSDTLLADPVPYLTVASRALVALGQYDEAEPLCRRILTCEHAKEQNREQALRYLAQIALARGQVQVAVAYQQEALTCLDTLRSGERREKVLLVSDYYRSQQREQRMQRLQHERDVAQQRFLVACFLIISLLLAAGVVWLWFKRRRAERLLTHERALTAFKSSELCQRLYALYYAQRPVPDEVWQEVEDYLNDTVPRFVPRLRGLTTFSETEWHLSLLARLDFRNVEIATLLCKHRSAISLAKKRLYVKVCGREGKAEDWDNLLRSLEGS